MLNLKNKFFDVLFRVISQCVIITTSYSLLDRRPKGRELGKKARKDRVTYFALFVFISVYIFFCVFCQVITSGLALISQIQ